DSENVKKDLYAQALFARAHAFLKLTEVFTVPYNDTNADQELGIVLRLSSDVNTSFGRSTLRQTYEQILKDLHEALIHISSQNYEYPTRANKSAVLGMLARCYLIMRK